MTEVPPIGSIVIVTKPNVTNHGDWTGLKYRVVKHVTGFPMGILVDGKVVENFTSKTGVTIKVDRDASFYVDQLEFVEPPMSQKLGEAIVVFKREFSNDFINSVNHVGEVAGLKFLRTYLNGRHQEYIYEASEMKAVHALMANPSVKSLMWIPSTQT